MRPAAPRHMHLDEAALLLERDRWPSTSAAAAALCVVRVPDTLRECAELQVKAVCQDQAPQGVAEVCRPEGHRGYLCCWAEAAVPLRALFRPLYVAAAARRTISSGARVSSDWSACRVAGARHTTPTPSALAFLFENCQ